ncbi:MAG TPA: FAD-binding oxidoreductase, partial [Thermomicrobiales bacterium]|nr:FAD-binding oxidoreductase [Thermomicrobiales bacterium]
SFSSNNSGLLQGPPEQWVEEIAGLAIEHGFSTVIYPGDNPRATQLFAEEVVPGVREMVDRERQRAGTDTTLPRSNRALSLRSNGIGYDALPESLASKAVEPGDFGYERARHSYMRAGSPGLVIFAENVADVQEALAFARLQEVPLGIRSGGHGISGRSTNDDGIILDLSRMKSMSMLDAATGTIRVEPGAVWGDVAAFLAPFGRSLTSGDYGDVGVGGLATAGGVGYLGRKFGLTIDHMVAAEIVLADGTFLRVDDEQHTDLFWAIRGAGGNFGVVTAFEFTTDPVDQVVFGILIADATNTAPLLERWGRIVEESPREVTSFVTLVPESRENPTIAQFIIVYAGDEIEAASTAITPFYEQLGPVIQQQAQLVPYAAIVAPFDSDHTGKGLDATRSGLVEHVSPQVAQGLESMLANRETQFAQIRAVGGAVNDLPADATAYAHRHQNFSVLAATTTNREAALDRGWSRIKPYLDGMYLSFETGTGQDVIASAFPPATLARLRDLKQKYDPDNVFNQNFNVKQEAVIAL